MTGSDKELYPNGEQIERRDIGPTRVGKRQKAKGFFKRFWWIFLILFIVGALVITLPLIYVGFPRIAQHGVDQSYNEVTSLQFFNPTNESVEITQIVTLHSPSMYTPTLDSFTAGTYLVTNGQFASDPIIDVQIPSVHVQHPTSTTSVTNQTAKILNMDQLTDYATQVMINENVTTALVGSTKLHEGKLPVTTVQYNSSSTYLGLNRLKGFNVTDIRIDPSNTLLILPNMNGTAYIPNPSVITVELGNVSFVLATEKSGPIGHVEIQNMVIRPGDNNLPLTGVLNQTLALGNTVNGFLNITITGDSVIYNGEHITYYEKSLEANVLNLTLNVEQILKDSIGI
ncbi:hypothetical protein LSUE1_G005828 [Lachnellula suecica]|uniref:Uncharacterized protein n=1 Tax=Lachnellula suecica TaxID=602035 RepID=A0A8T9C4M7_9HELO|nr:hypothetical protein LSUE1_G005828 [Lachnellula suecica]